jgi:hypothetical protein
MGLALGLALAAPASAWAQATVAPVPAAVKQMGLTDVLGGRPAPEVAPLALAGPRTFGPTSEVAHVISAAEFEANLWSDPWLLAPTPSPYGLFRIPLATVTFWAGLQLPAGALITRVELDGCDFSAVGAINALLASWTSPAGTPPPLTMAAGSTGVASMPGCGIFPLTFMGGVTPADRTIDNAGHYYIVAVNLVPPSVGFSNVRVYYTLQVSPAPGAASFTDVPTSHPFFQFIEALKASGITAGCSATAFCPDDPLTRSQMAVFLSKGLGLHFAP